MDLPEAASADDEPQRRFRVPRLEGAGERDPKVVVLVLDECEPPRLLASREPRLGPFSERDEVLEMPSPGLVPLARRAQSLEGVVPHDLEHREARLDGLALSEEALVHQSVEPIQHRAVHAAD
jgi:hypothetical protein